MARPDYSYKESGFNAQFKALLPYNSANSH
ncbi:hypothetical protein BH09BAC5_BH09BAC5_11630 [soil metagenome]